MKTIVMIEIDHRKPIPALANMVAGRAYTIDGVTNTEVLSLQPMTPDQLQRAGFTAAEIALGSQEVERG